MKVPDLPIRRIPEIRVARTQDELHKFVVADQKALEQYATEWVRTVATKARDEVLNAGNPPIFITEIDGITSGKAGTSVVRGSGFHAGAISSAHHSVRVTWVGTGLADVANRMKPVLVQVIAETFPQSRSKRLQSPNNWVWFIQPNANMKGQLGNAAVRLGQTVPDTVGIYDVLWLAPTDEPRNYAWFANRLIQGAGAADYNLKKVKKGGIGGFKLRKRMRGYLSEATRRMRGGGTKNRRQAGTTVQGWFVKDYLTGPGARSKKYGVPAVRIAFRRGLQTGV